MSSTTTTNTKSKLEQSIINNRKRLTSGTKYRSRTEIISSILQNIKDETSYDSHRKMPRGVFQTRIMYKSFLSYAQLREYLALLISNDLIKPVSSEIMEFIITNKGDRYLKISQELKEMLDVNKTKIV